MQLEGSCLTMWNIRAIVSVHVEGNRRESPQAITTEGTYERTASASCKFWNLSHAL